VTSAYRLTPEASDGLSRALHHVAEQFGFESAARAVSDLESAFELPAACPEAGHRRTDRTNDEQVRFWSVGPTLIAYRRGSECIEILLIERADLDGILLLGQSLD
jgi:plasmid stabilization system protein ParE